MSDILVIGGGFGGNWFAQQVGAPVLTRSNGYDINRNLAGVVDQICLERPRVIVNFASQSMVAQSWNGPADWMHTNCVGITCLLEAVRGLTFIEKYIHFTTPEVYGSTNGWKKEGWDFRPASPYAVSRAAGDWMVKLWQERHGFPAIFTRAANIYGEGQQLYRIIPRALRHKIEGEVFALNDGRHQRRAFVHMHDVTAALKLLIEKGEVGETYHISPHQDVAIGEVVHMCGCGWRVVPETPQADRRDEAYLLNSDKIMAMGWKPEVSLVDGIARVEGWMRSNRETWAQWPTEYRHTA